MRCGATRNDASRDTVLSLVLESVCETGRSLRARYSDYVRAA